MTKIKYDITLMKFIALFENITRAKVKDCFVNGERLVFVVSPGFISKAIGKNGSNIKRLESMLKKKIKIVEYSEDKLRFIKNWLMPLKVTDIKEEDGIVTVTAPDTQTRGLMIGRSAQNLRGTEEVVRRYFEVKEIKIV